MSAVTASNSSSDNQAVRSHRHGSPDELLLDAFACRDTADGASTLDMIKRIDATQLQAQPSHVRNEMLLQARAAMNVQQSRSTCQPLQNTTTLGERLTPPKERVVPGTPVTRTLRCGRLVRSDGKDDALFASRSEPALPHPRRVLYNQLRSEALATSSSSRSEKDALDVALSSTASTRSKSQQQLRVDTAVELTADARLAERRTKLEDELLHVTKKLNRKYTKQLFPPRTLSPSAIHSLAAKWSDTAHAPTDRERYDLYMASRFATQVQLDYYERALEPRDAANNRHRRNAAHTKYGDALVANRNSLRGKF